MLLQINHIDKTFGPEQVLRDCGLTLPAGHTLSILGRSGSGKTTLLKIIAGLEMPDRGEVLLDDRRMNDVPPQRRGMVYLYQEPLLFPHLTIFDNVAFGLRLRRLPDAEVRERTGQMLADLDLADHARKGPEQLSGGQRQRVAFGRAIIVNPRVLLLDEPFGALDTETRADMQALFQRLARRYRITSIFVTHDLKEALLMGDRLAVMDHGRLKHYADRKAFIDDGNTGVRGEMDFWRGLDG